jgi:hypothetical protein
MESNGAFGHSGLDGLLIDVGYDDPVPALYEALSHIGAHFSKADHNDFHINNSCSDFCGLFFK